MLLPGFLSPFVVGKLLVSNCEDAGSFIKFEVGLPKLVKRINDLLYSLFQSCLGSRGMPFHHILC